MAFITPAADTRAKRALYRGEVAPDLEALRNCFKTEIMAYEDRKKSPKQLLELT